MTETKFFKATNIKLTAPYSDTLIFDLQAPAGIDISELCQNCPLVKVCNGEKYSNTGTGRINLAHNIVQKMPAEKLNNVPCGVGENVFQQSRLVIDYM